jgi:type IX secretion system PorP/SprF family membrane protein
MELNIDDESDPYFAGNQNITKPTFGAGAILSSENLFIGLSVPRMLKNKETFGSGASAVEANLYSQSFYGMAAYIFLLNERVSLKPAALFKYVQGNPVSVDINTLFTIDERYGIGAFSRNFKTYGFLAQLKFARAYRFAYAYELPAGKSVGVNFSTHEVTLSMSMAVFGFHDIDGYKKF